MKSGKGHQEEEEEAYEEFGTKKHASTSANNTKDGKNGDKATAMRSKHSVTEQRRRSKINERFQNLRELIPDSDQKRDTASFLLEVIKYVTYLKEKVQHYEVSYQPLTSEPAKLTPWPQRKNYWNMQGFAGQPQPVKSGSGPGSAFSNRFDESNITPTTMHPVQQNPIEPDPIRDASSRPMDTINEQTNQAIGMNVPLQASMPVPVLNDGIFSHTLSGQVSDEPSTEGPSSFDALNPQDDLTIEGGTISISSVYSQGLLNSLAQALQSTGVDLCQANISVQINLGKRANTGSMPGIAITKDHGIPMPSGNQPAGHFHGLSNNEDSDQAHKKLRIG